MSHDRRAVLSALGAALPLGLPALAGASPGGPPPGLRFVPFEEAVRAALRTAPPGAEVRVEVGHSEAVRAGLQGCTNDRRFAGVPAGGLRIVRTGAGPGPEVGGVRLYVATLDLVRTESAAGSTSARPLDFASLPPTPLVVSGPLESYGR